MPWSAWIQPADIEQTPNKRMIAYSSPDADPPVTLVNTFDNAEFWIGKGLPWNAVQFRSATPTLSPLPYPMSPADEGTVYEAIPGSDPGDPYRFVDYESDAAVIQRWFWPPYSYPYGGPFIETITGSPGSGFASIVEPTDYDDVDAFPAVPGLQAGGIPTKPTGGVPFATFTGTEPDGAELTDPPEIGPHQAFTLVAELDSEPLVDDRIYFSVPRNPVAVYRPPRYRYWIPGGAPLRLMQRGDNLGMGSARLFGPGTRQGSGRLFGSL